MPPLKPGELATALLTQFKSGEGPGKTNEPAVIPNGRPELEASESLDAEALIILFMKLKSKLQENQLELSREGIQHDMSQKKETHEKQIEKIREAYK